MLGSSYDLQHGLAWSRSRLENAHGRRVRLLEGWIGMIIGAPRVARNGLVFSPTNEVAELPSWVEARGHQGGMWQQVHGSGLSDLREVLRRWSASPCRLAFMVSSSSPRRPRWPRRSRCRCVRNRGPRAPGGDDDPEHARTFGRGSRSRNPTRTSGAAAYGRPLRPGSRGAGLSWHAGAGSASRLLFEGAR